MAINHADHDHANTPAARAKCRKAMASDVVRLDTGTDPSTGESGSEFVRKPRTVIGGVVPKKGPKGLRGSNNLKKPGTHLRTIGDLPDVPRMLAYGARLAWANDWEVVVGEPFNDNEARILIGGKVAQVSMVWRPSVPDGVWGIFVRHTHSSVTHKVASVQEAFELAATDDAWDIHGNLIGL
jgi:hypothetical protein